LTIGIGVSYFRLCSGEQGRNLAKPTEKSARGKIALRLRPGSSDAIRVWVPAGRHAARWWAGSTVRAILLARVYRVGKSLPRMSGCHCRQ